MRVRDRERESSGHRDEVRKQREKRERDIPEAVAGLDHLPHARLGAEGGQIGRGTCRDDAEEDDDER